MIFCSNRYISYTTQNKENISSDNKHVHFATDTELDDTHHESMNNGSVDVVRFLLPGFCHLTAEPKLRSMFTGHKGHTMLQKYIHGQWEVMVQSSNVQTEVVYRSTSINVTLGRHPGSNSILCLFSRLLKDTLNVCCSILHNIILEDSALITQDEIFVNIYRWVLSSLITLRTYIIFPRIIILIKNVSILYLMI